MPELTLATEIQRQKQILEVLRLKTEESLTVREACDRVGIPTTTYYRHVHNNKEFLEELRETMVAQEKELLGNLVYGKNKVIYQLMEFAVSPDLTLNQAISLSEHLAKVQEYLENRTGEHGIADDDAKEFLEKHVNLKPAESRFKASAPVNMKARKDGSIDFSLLIDDGDIVDVDFS
jgi:AcrR family transcriptional regulator